MGGIGSGSAPRRVGPLVEDLFKLDLQPLKADKLLGSEFMSIVKDESKPPFSVHMLGDTGGIDVSYTWDDEYFHQRIEYEVIPQTIGGFQYFLKCPDCGKKRHALYLNQSIACRECHGAAYACENMNLIDRARLSRQRKAGMLDCHPDDLLPLKPKYMHWSTYEKHFIKLYQAQNQLNGFTNKRIEWLEKTAAKK